MADEEKEVVQGEQVSKEETVSEEVKPEEKEEPKVEPKDQPFSEAQEARMQQLMTEAKETGRREMQAIKDREVTDANRRARLAESDSTAYRTSFADLDEESRNKAELARLQSREVISGQAEQAESYRQQLKDSLVSSLEVLGIDPNDRRIDWAENETSLFAGRSKFDASVARILREDRKVSEDKQSQTFKDMEAKMRKDLGLDSVVTDISAGTSSGIPTDLEKFKEWVKVVPQAEYEALKPEIDKMQAAGKIK